MVYLNLSEGFNPFGAETDQTLMKFETFIFAGGEPHIKLHSNLDAKKVTITSRVQSSADLITLLLAKDALDRAGNWDYIGLFIPYFPGARQDRKMVQGEPLTAAVIANLINNAGFNEVSVMDPHSDVTPALLNNCTVWSNHIFVQEALHQIQPKAGFRIVSPDSGANKKILKLVQSLAIGFLNGTNDGFGGITKCDKTRDIATGKITNFEVYAEDLEGQDCVIVDDICDGGGTFIGLAEELKRKNAGNLYLVVTHGIFSKGVVHLRRAGFNEIYSTDSIKLNMNFQDPPQIIKLTPNNLVE